MRTYLDLQTNTTFMLKPKPKSQKKNLEFGRAWSPRNPMEQDHYKTLGVNRSATKEEIKTAFHKAARKFHPDGHPEASPAVRASCEAQFKRASEAYQTLVDERKRADYDFRCRSRNTSSNSNRNTSSRSGSRSGFGTGSGSGSGYGTGTGSGNYQHHTKTKYRSGGGGWTFYWSSSGTRSTGFDLRILSELFGTRGFLLGLGYAGVLAGSALFIEKNH